MNRSKPLVGQRHIYIKPAPSSLETLFSLIKYDMRSDDPIDSQQQLLLVLCFCLLNSNLSQFHSIIQKWITLTLYVRRIWQSKNLLEMRGKLMHLWWIPLYKRELYADLHKVFMRSLHFILVECVKFKVPKTWWHLLTVKRKIAGDHIFFKAKRKSRWKTS